MRYLIDTNIFVYASSARDSLSADVKAILEDPDSVLVISAHAITEHLPLISSDTRFEFYRKQGLDLIFNEK